MWLGAFLVRHRALIGWLAGLAVILLSFSVVSLKIKLNTTQVMLKSVQLERDKANAALIAIKLQSDLLKDKNISVNRKVTAENSIISSKIASITEKSKSVSVSPIIQNQTEVDAIHSLREYAAEGNISWDK